VRIGDLRLLNPVHQDLISQSQQCGTDKQSQDARVRHAAQGANKNHGHGGIDTAPEQHGFEEIVGHSGHEQEQSEHHRNRGGVSAGHPDVGDGRQCDQGGRGLGDAQHQGYQCQQSSGGDPGQGKAQAHQEGLDESHSDYASRHRANGGGAEVCEMLAAARSHNLVSQGSGSSLSGWALGYQNSGQTGGRKELNQAQPETGHHGQGRFGQVADFGLQAGHQSGQVLRGLTPDSRFYRHRGVDWWGVARAAVANGMQGRVDQGASTLTMQLARMRFYHQDISFARKAREILLAPRIEARYSKDKILELYLNNVYFGGGAYGISAASQLYFGRSPKQLSLAQSALLAGLVQAPSILSPLVDRPAALRRMKLVLQRMQATGVITRSQLDLALREKLRFQEGSGRLEPMLKAPYFTTYAIAQLARQIPQYQLYCGGLEVSTTLDLRLQRRAEEELRRALEELGPGCNASQAALVLIENRTGAIRAMVGGRGWNRSNQFNRAWQAVRQPGSSFKPFVYAAALELGYTPESLVEDRPLNFGGWSPKNSDGNSWGTITLAQALAHSRNQVAAWLCQQVTPQRVADLAQSLGVQEKLTPHPSIALGSCEVSVLSMASAYSSLASGGIYRQPYCLTRITHPLKSPSQEGETRVTHPLKSPSQEGEKRVTHPFKSPSQEGEKSSEELDLPPAFQLRVLPSHVAADLLSMMIGVVQHGTGGAAALWGVEVAGKTGTTDDCRDAWFVGSTPEYTLAVWVGNDDYSRMWSAYGGGLPAILWQRVMRHTLLPGQPARFGFLVGRPRPPRAARKRRGESDSQILERPNPLTEDIEGHSEPTQDGEVDSEGAVSTEDQPENSDAVVPEAQPAAPVEASSDSDPQPDSGPLADPTAPAPTPESSPSDSEPMAP